MHSALGEHLRRRRVVGAVQLVSPEDARKGRDMTTSSIRAGRGVSQTLPGGTRDAGTEALQAAGRELLAAVGNQVLKVAVDHAVLKVDQVAARLDTIAAGGTPRSAPSRKRPGRSADSGERPEHPRHRGAARLDTVAAGGGRTPGSVPSRKRPGRSTGSGGQRPEHPTRAVKMGAAVSFVVRQAMHLLRLIKRLARQLLGALTRLLGRLQKLLGALVHRGVAAARQTVGRLREKLKDGISRGGVVMGAAGGLVKALGAGTNPIWGAVKGAIGGLSTKTKVLIVLALVLGLLLGPVVLVVVLLALLVFAVVAAVRTSAPT